MTYLWLAIIIILTIIELATVSLVTIWFIASGIVALILSFFNVPTIIQFAVFVLLGTILLLTTRKSLVKALEKTKQKTNLDRVTDMTGIVTETIEKDEIGEVKVDGKKWSAKADERIEQGKKVKILKIDGVKLIVEEEK